MLHIRRALVVAGIAGVLSGLALLFWPLDEPGVTGSALRPHYRDFGWYSYTPMPAHPTAADFSRAGITLPQELVGRHRLVAAAVMAAGGAAVGVARLSRRSTAG